MAYLPGRTILNFNVIGADVGVRNHLYYAALKTACGLNECMNPGFEKLQPYPFEKLAQLKSVGQAKTDKSPIFLSIGEPKHATPDFILSALEKALPQAASYPLTRGTEELRSAIAAWLQQRFQLAEQSITADKHILPVSGTREALFALAQCVVDKDNGAPLVISPNPFYQIYEGAALLAGAEPYYLNCTEATEFLPDFDQVPDTVWQRCQLIYLCSPNNPSGAVINLASYKQLFELADQYDFVIAADECYSEIYTDENKPPLGLLQAASSLGRNDYAQCMVFHSLSKRSNVPGMRSGFVAGDAHLIQNFLRYRTYHGCSMPPYTQTASICAWQDENHVKENRSLYRQKFDAVLEILQPVMNVRRPDAGFYLWPETPVCDKDFAQQLYLQQNVTVLPGSFLSRASGGIDPGSRRVRMALVASVEECIEAAERIKTFINQL